MKVVGLYFRELGHIWRIAMAGLVGNRLVLTSLVLMVIAPYAAYRSLRQTLNRRPGDEPSPFTYTLF